MELSIPSGDQAVDRDERGEMTAMKRSLQIHVITDHEEPFLLDFVSRCSMGEVADPRLPHQCLESASTLFTSNVGDHLLVSKSVYAPFKREPMFLTYARSNTSI